MSWAQRWILVTKNENTLVCHGLSSGDNGLSIILFKLKAEEVCGVVQDNVELPLVEGNITGTNDVVTFTHAP